MLYLPIRDEPSAKKAKKENGAAGDTANSTGQQTQAAATTHQGHHDQSNAYNYYGGQWGGQYVSTVLIVKGRGQRNTCYFSPGQLVYEQFGAFQILFRMQKKN